MYVNVVLFIISVEVIKQFEVKQRCILHFKHFILKTSPHSGILQHLRRKRLTNELFHAFVKKSL